MPGVHRNPYISAIEINVSSGMLFALSKENVYATITHSRMTHTYSTRATDFARINFPVRLTVSMQVFLSVQSPAVGTCCIRSKRFIFQEEP